MIYKKWSICTFKRGRGTFYPFSNSTDIGGQYVKDITPSRRGRGDMENIAPEPEGPVGPEGPRGWEDDIFHITEVRVVISDLSPANQKSQRDLPFLAFRRKFYKKKRKLKENRKKSYGKYSYLSNEALKISDFFVCLWEWFFQLLVAPFKKYSMNIHRILFERNFENILLQNISYQHKNIT